MAVIAEVRGRRRLVAGLALMAALVVPSLAQADVAAAEALYREGRALMEKGDLDAACPKLAESQRLDPSSGTALNLALCHLKQGKTATAWAEYLVAARVARQQGKPERVEEAQKRAAELETGLSYLTIVVPSPLPGLEVRRDEVLVEAGSFGARIPIDPGKHRVVVSAPGHASKSLEIVIGAARDAHTLAIPTLEKVGAPSSDSGAPKEAGGPGALPWVVGGVGIAVVGVGAAFGGLALSAYSDAKAACPTRTGCAQEALDSRSQANVRAKVADVMIPVGIAAVGAGVVLYLVRRPRAAPPPAAASSGAQWTFDAEAGPQGTRAWITATF